MPAARWIALDIAAVAQPADWLPHLAGVGAVVNCAGVLQDGPRDSTRGVHADGAAALFAACERAAVRRVIHFSAIGVDRAAPTDFSRTKIEGDEMLLRRDLDWVILRPSVVLGPAAYGGSALFRGLAALPVLPVMPDTGLLQVVQLEDVVETVLFFLGPAAPSRLAVDLVGPEPLSVPTSSAAFAPGSAGRSRASSICRRLSRRCSTALATLPEGSAGGRPCARPRARKSATARPGIRTDGPR